jgi:hypothetical protein
MSLTLSDKSPKVKSTRDTTVFETTTDSTVTSTTQVTTTNEKDLKTREEYDKFKEKTNPIKTLGTLDCASLNSNKVEQTIFIMLITNSRLKNQQSNEAIGDGTDS